MALCNFLFKVLGVYLVLKGAINSGSGRFLDSVKYIQHCLLKMGTHCKGRFFF